MRNITLKRRFMKSVIETTEERRKLMKIPIKIDQESDEDSQRLKKVDKNFTSE